MSAGNGEARADGGAVDRDELDLTRLRLPQNFAAQTGVKKLLTTVPVRKPDRSVFVRVRPDPSFRFQANVLEQEGGRESYIVTPDVADVLGSLVAAKELYTAIDRQGTVFLWPVKLPPPDRAEIEWTRSAREAAAKAMGSWIRVQANMSLGAYEIFEASGQLPDPAWPDVSFTQLMNLAFRGKVIDAIDHPVVRKLQGLI